MYMIQIRAYYGDWKTVEEEHAKNFVIWNLTNMPAISSLKERIKRVNEKHLRGIKVEELLTEEELLCLW